MQKAIILKDLRTIATNKRMLAVLLIVPLIMMVVVPTIIVLTLSLAPLNSPDFQELAGMLLPRSTGRFTADAFKSAFQQCFAVVFSSSFL